MIFIILPAYNEEMSLPKLLPKIIFEFEKRNEQFHLIAVNDGSIDKTKDILESYLDKINITIINHSINRGLGETERDGFEAAAEMAEESDYIVRVEGDDTHDPKYIFDIIAKLDEGYDVVNTSRFQPGGDQLGLNSYRKGLSKLANLFMKVMFNVKGVKDYSCGFRGYKAYVLKDAIEVYGNAFLQLKGLGFTATLETLIKLKVLGCRFAEVPFVLRYDLKESESKMVSSITTLGYFTMALLYHWPWGGWKRQYRGLNKLYQTDRAMAIKQINIRSITRRTISRIGG